MDIETMNNLSTIIRREKITNNILFMLKSSIPVIEETALEHGKYLYALIKLFSNTGFNIELEEPKHINYTKVEIIKMLLNDIILYSELIRKSPHEIVDILTELMKIKASIISHLLTKETA